MTSGVRADEAEDLKAALQQLAQLLNGQLAKTFAASESESTPLRPATRQIGLGSPKLNVAASVQGTASGLTTTDAWRQMFPKK